MEKNWHGIMKIVEIQHLDSHNRILWQDHDIRNMLHYDGEDFILQAAFSGGRISTVIPESYYLGLDARTVISAGDTMDTIGANLEPTTAFGYSRQQLSSSGDFIVGQSQNTPNYLASSPIVAFTARGGHWGPVLNLFLTTAEDETGYLISSAKFSSPLTVNSGDSITMRIALMLSDSSTSRTTTGGGTIAGFAVPLPEWAS